MNGGTQQEGRVCEHVLAELDAMNFDRIEAELAEWKRDIAATSAKLDKAEYHLRRAMS